MKKLLIASLLAPTIALAGPLYTVNLDLSNQSVWDTYDIAKVLNQVNMCGIKGGFPYLKQKEDEVWALEPRDIIYSCKPQPPKKEQSRQPMRSGTFRNIAHHVNLCSSAGNTPSITIIEVGYDVDLAIEFECYPK